MFFINRPTA